jgi:hypothetical protein
MVWRLAEIRTIDLLLKAKVVIRNLVGEITI